MHRIILYLVVIWLRILFLYTWTYHGISADSGVVITNITRRIMLLHEERQYETNSQIQNFCQVSYCIFYSIQVAIMISTINFTELRSTILSSLHGSDEPWTLLASSNESRVLTTRAQPMWLSCTLVLSI